MRNTTHKKLLKKLDNTNGKISAIRLEIDKKKKTVPQDAFVRKIFENLAEKMRKKYYWTRYCPEMSCNRANYFKTKKDSIKF